MRDWLNCLLMINSQCVISPCPANKYSANNICYDCDPACDGCTGKGYSQCKACSKSETIPLEFTPEFKKKNAETIQERKTCYKRGDIDSNGPSSMIDTKALCPSQDAWYDPNTKACYLENDCNTTLNCAEMPIIRKVPNMCQEFNVNQG